jgi:hypothetical protein
LCTLHFVHALFAPSIRHNPVASTLATAQSQALGLVRALPSAYDDPATGRLVRQDEGGCSMAQGLYNLQIPSMPRCYEKTDSSLPRLLQSAVRILFISLFSVLIQSSIPPLCLSIHNSSLKSSNGGFHPNCTRNRCFRAWSRTYPWQELGFAGPDFAAHQRRRSARPDYRYWHLPYRLARIVYSCGIWCDVPEGSGP